MNSPRARLIVAIVLAFALGWWAGGMTGRKHGWHRRDPQQRHQRLVQRFSRQLDLTLEQQTAISGILESSHLRMRSLHDQVRPQFEALRADTSQQIRAQLRPEQIPKFESMEAKFRERWSKRRGRWGGTMAEPMQKDPAQEDGR